MANKDSKVLGASGDFEVELVGNGMKWGGGDFDGFIHIYIYINKYCFVFIPAKKAIYVYIYIYIKIACTYGVLIGFDCCLFF